jgi:hypothetical protein
MDIIFVIVEAFTNHLINIIYFLRADNIITRLLFSKTDEEPFTPFDNLS